MSCGVLLGGTYPHLGTHDLEPRTTETGGAPPIHPVSGCLLSSPRLGRAGTEGGMRGQPPHPRVRQGCPAEYRLPGGGSQGGLTKNQEASWRIRWAKAQTIMSPPPRFLGERRRGRAQGADGLQRPLVSSPRKRETLADSLSGHSFGENDASV